VYRQAPTRAAEVRGQIPAEVMSLVKLYDGKRPVIDVVEDSPFKPFDTVKITFRLAELGAIERVDSAANESPLTAQLAVRDWLLGAGDTDRVTVTEAGRRAAEAYAAEEAKRAATPRPTEDLFGDADDTDRAMKLSAAELRRPEPAAPAVAIEDVPTAPREAKRGPEARNKKKRSRSKSGRHELLPPAKLDPANVDQTVPFNKISMPPPVPPTNGPARAGAPYHRPEAAHKAEAKLSAQSAQAAHEKEPMFDDLDEEFFASEAQLHKVEPVENFDDLDSGPKRKAPSARRGWFGFGAKKPSAPTKR
jgi:hypothetical protein